MQKKKKKNHTKQAPKNWLVSIANLGKIKSATHGFLQMAQHTQINEPLFCHIDFHNLTYMPTKFKKSVQI